MAIKYRKMLKVRSIPAISWVLHNEMEGGRRRGGGQKEGRGRGGGVSPAQNELSAAAAAAVGGRSLQFP